MKTDIEALFEALVNSGWADDANGDVEAPSGYYAMISTTAEEVSTVLSEFSDVLGVYGQPSPEDITGFFLIRQDSQGFTYVDRYDSREQLQAAFRELDQVYSAWAES